MFVPNKVGIVTNPEAHGFEYFIIDDNDQPWTALVGPGPVEWVKSDFCEWHCLVKSSGRDMIGIVMAAEEGSLALRLWPEVVLERVERLADQATSFGTIPREWRQTADVYSRSGTVNRNAAVAIQQDLPETEAFFRVSLAWRHKHNDKAQRWPRTDGGYFDLPAKELAEFARSHRVQMKAS